MTEAVHNNYRHYVNFSAFFTRHLKPGLRPQSANQTTITSPVDGSISQLGYLNQTTLLQAKKQHYDLLSLLGNHMILAEPFYNGSFLTAYLAPKNYHRVHMPVSGQLKSMHYIPGRLFSVNAYTTRHIPNVFARNERVICEFDTEHGPMMLIMIGAIIVGSIATQWHGIVRPSKRYQTQAWRYQTAPIRLKRGDEVGYFTLGSSVILLFSQDVMTWTADLAAGQPIQIGQSLGSFTM